MTRLCENLVPERKNGSAWKSFRLKFSYLIAIMSLTASQPLTAGAATATVKASPDKLLDAACNESIGFLKDYLRIDTTNPPGNETKGAQYLADIFKSNGIEASLLETGPGRSCVYARLKGNGKKKPIIFLNHIDVVPARAEDWKHPPFSGEEFDGAIWGRGALDMKGFGIAQAEVMLMLKRSGLTLERDVIFVGTPDEEVGGECGAGWFVKHHADLVKDAEFLINEGAFIDSQTDGKPVHVDVGISEKSVLWLHLTARGNAGHASMPMPDSSVNRLLKSVGRIVENPPPPTILPAVREYFKKIAPTVGEPLRTAYANIDDSVTKPDTYQEVLKDKMKSAMLRNTVSPTVLKAGYKTNVIPAEASAELDCRLLPGVGKDEFIGLLRDRMKDNTIEVSVLDWVHTDASPYDTECFKAINEVAGKLVPGVPVVPTVAPWFTDSHWFRELGITSYGFAPFRIDAELLATMHGKDERLPIAVYKDGLKFLYDVTAKLCTNQ